MIATLFAIMLCCIPSISSICSLLESQRIAVKTLYDTTNGADWVYPSYVTGNNWNFSVFNYNPCDNWKGLNCSACANQFNLSTVSYLNLTEFRLRGSLLDATFSNLSSLVVLDLNSNSITGQLPPSIQHFHNLTVLSINDNLLTGTLSPQLFTPAMALRAVFLSGNQLRGSLPTSLFSLSALSYLYVSNNHLTGSIPNEIGLATTLQNLFLNINSLSGHFPDSIQSLTHLQYSSFSLNRLSGRLEFIGNWTSLVYLGIRNNMLTGSIPLSIANCQKLTILRLDNNELHGSLPWTFKQMKSLIGLTLSSNHFTGSIDIFDSDAMANITSINLDNNGFTGTIPDNLFRLPLQLLSLSQNCFSGSLPNSICEASTLFLIEFDGLSSGYACRHYFFSRLSKAYVPFNFIDGSIPRCTATLKNLSTFHFAGNGIHSRLESNSFFVNPNLQELSISYNQLTGSIPMILQSSFIPYRDFSYNRLKGTMASMALPTPVISQNYTLYMEVNRLSGDIPVSFHNAFSSIQILAGNLFQCSSATLPSKDPLYRSYICGSEQLNESEYAFFLVFGCVVLALLFTKLYRTWNIDNKTAASQTASSDSHTLNLAAENIKINELAESQGGQRPPTIGNQNKDNDYNYSGDNGLSTSTRPISYQFTANQLGTINALLHAASAQNLNGTNNFQSEDDFRNSFTRDNSFALNAYAHAKITSSMTTVGTDSITNDNGLVVKNKSFFEIHIVENYDNLNLWVHHWLETLIFGCTGYRMFAKQILEMPKLFRYVKLMHQFRLIFVIILAVDLVVLLPLYIIFSAFPQYSSHTYKYKWATTSAFARGYLPTVLLLVIWMLIAWLSVWRIISIKGILKREEKKIGITKKSVSKKEKSERYLEYVQRKRIYKESRTWSNFLALGHSHKVFALCWVIALINIGCIIGLNVGYIVGEFSNISLLSKFFLQLGTAVVKVVWNLFILRSLIGLITKYKGDPTDKKVNLYIGLVAFNNIAAPIVATFFTDSRCLRTVFFPDSPIVSTFNMISCGETLTYLGAGVYQTSCANDISSTISFSYDPPFIYSYQCGSAIVTNYVPMFNYSYTIFMLWPLLQIVLTRCNPNWIPKFILYWLPGAIWPTADHTHFKRIMNPDIEIMQQLLHLFLLLTFGVTSVQLCVAICCSALASSIVSQILVVRFIRKRTTSRRSSNFCSSNPIFAESTLRHSSVATDSSRLSMESDSNSNSDYRDSTLSQASMAIHYHEDDRTAPADAFSNSSSSTQQTSILGLLENACSGSWRRLLNGGKLVFLGASCFYACILFDMAADEDIQGPLGGIWVPIVCIFTPIALYAARVSFAKSVTMQSLSVRIQSMKLFPVHAGNDSSTTSMPTTRQNGEESSSSSGSGSGTEGESGDKSDKLSPLPSTSSNRSAKLKMFSRPISWKTKMQKEADAELEMQSK